MVFRDYKTYLKEKEILCENLKGKFGCILEFKGFVREYDLKEGERVPAKGLHIKELVIEKLKGIREEAIRNFDLVETIIYHATGFLKVGEMVASIAIFAKHRQEAFLALSFIIDEMKKYH